MITFESFSYPLFDFSYRADFPSLVRSFLEASATSSSMPGKRGIYIHIPFCETICSFCPFVKYVGSAERVERYLGALLREVRMVAETQRLREWTVDAVYVGGGTPSVLSEEQIARLLSVVTSSFRLADDVEISFELEVKSVSDSRLEVLREGGVTRLSFGAQTFDPKIREDANLTATVDQIYAGIEAMQRKFSNTNMDMLVGWPGQTEEHALAEMEHAARSGVGSVSLYPIDYVMVAPTWVDRIQRGDLPPPPSLEDRGRMFTRCRDELGASLTEQNIYCFGTDEAPACRYMFDILYGRYQDECVGIGAGAYSFLQGLAYYNVAKEDKYVETIESGDLPVALASPGHAYEKSLVFFPKRTRMPLADIAEVDIEPEVREKIDAAVDAGLVAMDSDVLTLTAEGRSKYAELMVYFFSDAQKRIYRRVCGRLRSPDSIVGADEWVRSEESIRSIGAIQAMFNRLRLSAP